MKAPDHAACSTNWKPGFDASKFHQISSETRNVSTVTPSDTLRMLRRCASLSPRIRKKISAAPTSGRNVTVERMGQFIAAA